jgi:hypothetical protein
VFNIILFLAIFILTICSLIYSYRLGIRDGKKIQVKVTQDCPNWYGHIKTKILEPVPHDCITTERHYSDDYYIWLEVEEIALRFNRDFTEIQIYRKEKNRFSCFYHEIINKQNPARFSKMFFHTSTSPGDGDMLFSSPGDGDILFSVDSVSTLTRYSSYYIQCGTKEIVYNDNDMDGIWDTMDIKDNTNGKKISYKYCSDQLRWYVCPTDIPFQKHDDSNR